MKDYFKFIKEKLENKIIIENIEIIDNTSKHKNHKHFVKNKYHLHLKIKSLYLKSISKISAQRLIMNILRDELKNKIHALEISIE